MEAVSNKQTRKTSDQQPGKMSMAVHRVTAQGETTQTLRLQHDHEDIRYAYAAPIDYSGMLQSQRTPHKLLSM